MRAIHKPVLAAALLLSACATARTPTGAGGVVCAAAAVPAEANLVVYHDNQMGYPYTVRWVRLGVDGKVVFERKAEEKPLCDLGLHLYAGALPPGEHYVTLHMALHAPGTVSQQRETNRQDAVIHSNYAFELREQRKLVLRAQSVRLRTPNRDVPNLQFFERSGPSVASYGSIDP